MKTLLRFWRVMPMWVHFLAAKLVRPKFRAAVAAVIFDEQGRILLFKHTYRKFEWGIPAGGLEHYEQPIEAIIREFFEETGMQIQVERLLAGSQFTGRPSHQHDLFVQNREWRIQKVLEISEMKYFDVNELPE